MMPKPAATLKELLSAEVIVTFYSDGALQKSDMVQCQKEKWVPIVAVANDDKVMVPCFRSHELAKKFGKRNFPKDWLDGTISLSHKEVIWMMEKGWTLHILDYPHIMKDREGFGHQVLEFQTDPDLYIR